MEITRRYVPLYHICLVRVLRAKNDRAMRSGDKVVEIYTRRNAWNVGTPIDNARERRSDIRLSGYLTNNKMM